MQPKRGLELGRPFGFPLLVHRSWLGAGALLVVHLALTSFGAERLLVALVWSAGVAVAIFTSLVLHEGAHALARRVMGVETVDATLLVFGGVARTSAEARRPVEEAAIALAGPVASAALAAGSFAGRSFVEGAVSESLWTIGVANLVLAALNLLPVLPLDGGRLLVGFLQSRGRDRSETVPLGARGGEVAGTSMLIAGAWLTLTSSGAFADAGLGLWLMVVGAFVVSEAARVRRAAHVAAVVSEGTAGAWARPFAGRVRSSASVPAEGGPYAVSDGSRLAGILMPRALADGRGKRAGEVMIPWTADIALASDTPISSVLQRLASSRVGLLVVLDERGVVRGVIDSDGVQARLGAG